MIDMHIDVIIFFKSGMRHGWRMPGFLILLLCRCQYVCVFVCVCLPPRLSETIHVRRSLNDRLYKLYCFQIFIRHLLLIELVGITKGD